MTQSLDAQLRDLTAGEPDCVRFVRASDPTDSATGSLVESHNLRDLCLRHHLVLRKLRAEFWDRLAGSSDPEEKLACQREIDKLGQALGFVQHHEIGASVELRRAEVAAQAERDAHERALDRWR